MARPKRTVHGSYENLATELTRFDAPREWAWLIAKGIVQALNEICWDQCDDVLGSPSHVDELLPTPLPSEVLAGLLRKVQFAGSKRGSTYMRTAYNNAPQNRRAAWRKLNPDGYARASRRASPEPPITNRAAKQRARPGRSPRTAPALWADALTEEDAAPSTDGGGGEYSSAHTTLVSYFMDEWSRTHGAEYPFSPRDARCITDLRRRTRDIDHAKTVIDRYLANTNPWYAGHPLSKLLPDLPKFVAEARRALNRELPPEYDGDDIPQL